MSERRIICTVCPNSCEITVVSGENGEISSVSGFKCKRGDVYARAEVTAPVRTLTALVQIEGGAIAMCPVRTDRPVPKELLKKIAGLAAGIRIKAPVEPGDVIVKNIMGTQADLIVCRKIGEK